MHHSDVYWTIPVNNTAKQYGGRARMIRSRR